MSSASPYPFAHNKVVPIIFGAALTFLPGASGTAEVLPRAASAVGQQLDLQRATTSALLDEIAEKVGYAYYPDIIVPLPPPTVTLVGTVTFVQTDLLMPEFPDDYGYLA